MQTSIKTMGGGKKGEGLISKLPKGKSRQVRPEVNIRMRVGVLRITKKIAEKEPVTDSPERKRLGSRKDKIKGFSGKGGEKKDFQPA